MLRKIVHYTDSHLTEEGARQALENSNIRVAWYTNIGNRQSVVHSHPYYEVVLPIRGEALYSINGKLYYLHAGDLIVFPPEVFHTGKYDLGDDPSERLVVQFDAVLWHQTCWELGFSKVDWRSDAIVFNSDTISGWDLRGLFERMSMVGEMGDGRNDLLHTCQIAEFLGILCEIIDNSTTVCPTATSLLVAKAVEYLRRNYTNPDLTVTHLAAYTFVSREHLSRAFKEYTMESVHSYLTSLRMQHCRNAIANGSSILDACTESGFSDYSSFLKAFRKIYGVTPAQYRAQLRCPEAPTP